MYISNQTVGRGALTSSAEPVMKYRTKGQNMSQFLDPSLQGWQGGNESSKNPSGDSMERYQSGQNPWQWRLQDSMLFVGRSDADLLKSLENREESSWLSVESFVQEQTFYTGTLQDGTELSYRTIYEPDRIYCMRDGEEDAQWEIPLQDESQYDRIVSFLDGLKDRDNQSFTIHNTFWQDFLSGRLDVDAFIGYLETRGQDGDAGGLRLTEDGAYIDREAAKYSIYLYGPEFGAHIMRTTEEFLEWQRQQIEKVAMKQSKKEHTTTMPKQGKILGIGFLNAPGKFSYGMRAEYAKHSSADSPVIKVTIQRGGGLEEVHYVEMNHIDPRNATEIEMFALCCYADDTRKGTGGTYGTWQTLNYYRINASDIGAFYLTKSLDTCLSLRQNWMLMIEKMRNLYGESGMYQQSQDGDLLLKCISEVCPER